MPRNDTAIAEALALMVDLVPEKDVPTLIDRALKLLHESGATDTTAFVRHVMKALERGGKVLFAEIATPSGSVSLERRSSLIDALEKKYGKTVVLREREDASLLGGATLRIGDELFELSLHDEITRITSSPSSL